MASILKVDKIRGTGLDSDTISLDGTGNITIPKNVTFSGTQSGSFIKRSATNSSISGVASASVTGLSTTAKILTLFLHDVSTSTGTNLRYRVRANGADISSSSYELNAFYGDHGGTFQSEGTTAGDHFKFHSDWAGANNTYNIIVNFYDTGHSSLTYNFRGHFYNRGTGGSHYGMFAAGLTGRISLSHPIDGFTIYTADGNNFDGGSMSAITQE